MSSGGEQGEHLTYRHTHYSFFYSSTKIMSQRRDPSPYTFNRRDPNVKIEDSDYSYIDPDKLSALGKRKSELDKDAKRRETEKDRLKPGNDQDYQGDVMDLDTNNGAGNSTGSGSKRK